MTLDLDSWPVAYPHPTDAWTIRDNRGRWATYHPETGSTALVEPEHDVRLPGLAGAMSEGALLAYRVGRRAVLRSPQSYLKVGRPRRLDALVERHRFVVATGVRCPTAHPTDWPGVARLTPLAGTSLHERFRRGQADAETLEAVAAMLARFHDHRAPSGAAPAAAPDPERFVAATARLDSEAAGELRVVAAELPTIDAAGRGLVHADLHDKNVLIRDADAGLIDLDGVRRGRAEEDIANLSVHLGLRHLQAGCGSAEQAHLPSLLVDAYRSHRDLDRDLLEAHARHTWFRLACLYRFRRSSRHLTSELLRRARDG